LKKQINLQKIYISRNTSMRRAARYAPPEGKIKQTT
jgi:hypothetical protein